MQEPVYAGLALVAIVVVLVGMVVVVTNRDRRLAADPCVEQDTPRSKRRWYNQPVGCAGLLFLLMIVAAGVSSHWRLTIDSVFGAFLTCAVWCGILGIFYHFKDKRRKAP